LQHTYPLTSHEWALIAAFDGGEIPAEHRAIRDDSVKPAQAAWNQGIYDSGLKTQNCDKGFERFVRKFNPEEEMNATLAIVEGVHFEHGKAIYLTQKTRRYALLDTTYGPADDEALWYTLLFWAKFQPRLKSPRTEPGQLFEKYWQCLHDPQDHPEFSQETSFTQVV
jgi:hypothetical protein